MIRSAQLLPQHVDDTSIVVQYRSELGLALGPDLGTTGNTHEVGSAIRHGCVTVHRSVFGSCSHTGSASMQDPPAMVARKVQDR